MRREVLVTAYTQIRPFIFTIYRKNDRASSTTTSTVHLSYCNKKSSPFKSGCFQKFTIYRKL